MALTRPKIWDIDTTIMQVVDPITVLHQGGNIANVDIGFLFNRNNGTVSNVAIYWSESANTFVAAYTANTGAINSNIVATSYANVTVGGLITSTGIFWANGTAFVSGGSGTTFTGGYVPNQSTFGSNLVANSMTPTTTVNTGALVVVGGIGANGSANIGGNIVAGSTLNTASWTTVSNVNNYQVGMAVNANYSLMLGFGTQSNPNQYMTLAASGNKNNLYNTTRDFRVTAFNDNLDAIYVTNANGNVTINSTTTSVSTTTGALTVVGGVGISGNLNIGANASTYSGNYNSISLQGQLVPYTFVGSDQSITNTVLSLPNGAWTISGMMAANIARDIFSKDASNNIQIGSRNTAYVGNVTLIAGTGTTANINFVTGPGSVYSSKFDYGGNLIVNGNIFGNGLNITNTGDVSANIGSLLANAGAQGASLNSINANVGTLYLTNISTQANLGAFETYANLTFATAGGPSTSALSANLGAYQIYANANVGTVFNNLNTLTSNVGAYEIYANANIGTLYLGNISTQANLGSYQTATNANIGTLFVGNATTQANIGSFYTYANTSINTINANIGTLFLGNASTQANLGSYQTATNANIGGHTLSINSINANIGAYETYANTAISNLYTNANANTVAYLGSTTPVYVRNFSTANAFVTGGYADNFPIGANIRSTGAFTSLTASGITSITGGIDATSTTSGQLQVAGGAGITGNLWVGGNIYAANIIATVQNQITVQDPLLYLQATGNLGLYNYDIGFYSDYTAPIYAHTGLARSVNANAWVFFSNVKSEPTGTTVIWSDPGLIYDPIIAGNLVLANTTAATSTSTGALIVKGGAGIAGSLWINNTNDVSANIGTLFVGNATTQANLGAYQTATNANIGTIFNNLNTLTSNIGAYEIYANANIGTLYLNNISTQANLGAYQTYANANLATQTTNFNTLNANVGLYENTTNANIGAFYTYANTKIGTNTNSNLVVVATTTSTSTTTGALVVGGGTGVSGNINASGYGYFGGVFNESSTTGGVFLGNTGSGTPSPRIGLFNGTAAQNWQIDNFGGDFRWFTPGTTRMYLTASGSLSVNTAITSTSTTTGSMVIAGGAGFGGNINVGGLANIIYTPSTSTGAGVQVYGNGTQGGSTYIDFLRVTNTVTGATNPNKSFRLDNAGTVQIINSAYSTNIFNLTDAGDLTIPGKITISNGVFWANGAAYTSGGTAFTGGVVSSTIFPSGNLTLDLGTTSAFWSNVYTNNVIIGKNILWANGTVYSSGTGSTPFTGGYVPNQSTFGSNLVANSGVASSSTTTGALVVVGGAGIGGSLNIGNTGDVSANIGTLFVGNAVTQANVGAFELYANTKIGTNTNSNLVVVATTSSTSTTTGALVVVGGVGIAGNINASNIISTNISPAGPMTMGTTANTTTNAAITISGPAVINGNVNFGNNWVSFGNTTSSSGGGIYGAQLPQLGPYNSTYYGIWASGLTPSVSNYTFLISPTTVSINSPSSLTLGTANNNLLGFITSGTGSRTSVSAQGTQIIQQGLGVTGDSAFSANLGVLGNLFVSNGIFWANGTAYSSGSGTSFTGGYVPNQSTFGSNLVANSGVASSSTTTGALVVVGGAGISGQLTAGSGNFTSGLTATGFINLSPVNTNVNISPSGLGILYIQPTSGVAYMDGVTIGANTAAPGKFANVITTNGVFWANGVAYSTGGSSGVTQIVAGTNITISPSGGTGVVTINSTGGGGGSFTGGYVANQSTFGSNLVANSGATSTSNVTGAVVVAGGIGVSGNIVTTSNVIYANVQGGTGARMTFNPVFNSIDTIFG